MVALSVQDFPRGRRDSMPIVSPVEDGMNVSVAFSHHFRTRSMCRGNHILPLFPRLILCITGASGYRRKHVPQRLPHGGQAAAHADEHQVAGASSELEQRGES